MEQLSASHFEYDGLRYIGSYAPLFVHQYRRPGSICAAKRDKYSTTLRTRGRDGSSSPVFAWNWRVSFPIYSEISGDRLRIPSTAMWCWGGPPKMGRSMAPWGGRRRRGLSCSCRNPPACVEKHEERYGDRSWCKYGFVNALIR